MVPASPRLPTNDQAAPKDQPKASSKWLAFTRPFILDSIRL